MSTDRSADLKPQIKQIAADIASELRAKPNAWTQENYAKDARGNSVEVDSPKATCWCLFGHIDKRTGVEGVLNAAVACAFDRFLPMSRGLSDWNDAPERTVSDVIALCEKVTNAYA